MSEALVEDEIMEFGQRIVEDDVDELSLGSDGDALGSGARLCSEELPSVSDHDSPVVARKGIPVPRFMHQEAEEVELPDLDAFFLEFATVPEDRIRMCRTYANYLSSLLPKPFRADKGRKRSKKTPRLRPRDMNTYSNYPC